MLAENASTDWCMRVHTGHDGQPGEEVIVSRRLNLLDAAQIGAMASHARGWADRAHSTEAVNWARWESGVRACYQYAGVRWPTTVVQTSSPLAMARALFLARVQEVPGDEDRALVGLMRQVTQGRVDRVIGRLFGRGVVAQAQRAVYDPVEASAGGHAVAQAVFEALRDGALANDPIGVQDSARTAANRLVPGQKLGLVNRRMPPGWRSWALHLGGNHDSAWCAYASFLAGAYGTAGASGWRRRIDVLALAQSAGWWWPHLDFVLVSDRPRVVHAESAVEAPGRLHCGTGPAVVWRDGWRLYFWHGTRVPAWVIERPTVEAIHAEPNVEVRRCAIEALGWESYVTNAGLDLVDTVADPGNPGFELRLYNVPLTVLDAPTRVLLATNGSVERDGTRRRYGLAVPGDVNNALHAAAWTYGLTGEQYAQLARRT